MHSTSPTLLSRLKSVGDPEAWPRFVELYTPLIFFWARKTGLQSQDAADLVQDVLIQVYLKLPDFSYDESKSFRGWLRMVTLNKYREFRRRTVIQTTGLASSDQQRIADPNSAESTWDIDYARLLVARAIELMRKDYASETWEALKILMSSGRPPREVAEEIGVSVWTLYSARSKLMSRLRAELDGLL